MYRNNFIVLPNGKTQLKDYDSTFTGKFADEAAAEEKRRNDCAELAEQQDMLLAQETHAVLLIFQAMDGSAKDGTIKYVLSSVDPQGCTAHNFKEPSEEDSKHDYLWRFHKRIPERGQIGIFNRSYYEEVLSTRVHPERLAEQHLPITRKTQSTGNNIKNIWKQRYAEINNFEQYLTNNSCVVMKFFLHLSKEKQRERLLQRITLPEKQWKFSFSDVEERGHWDEYMRAYEDVLRYTSTSWAPWHIIPADHRWFSALTVGDLVLAKLKDLKLSYPQATGAEKQQLTKARKLLEQSSK